MAVVEGSTTHGLIRKAVIAFEFCNDRTDLEVPECMNARDASKWSKENRPEITVLYSHNFVDFESFD